MAHLSSAIARHDAFTMAYSLEQGNGKEINWLVIGAFGETLSPSDQSTLTDVFPSLFCVGKEFYVKDSVLLYLRVACLGEYRPLRSFAVTPCTQW